MIFSSIEFIIFFLFFIFIIKYFSKQQRNIIIIFSLFFYSFWNIYFVALILYFCFLTFIIIKKNLNLKASIFLLILPLIFFKYSNFLISFFDIKLLNKIFNKEIINFYGISEFILFFPQLIAGPILRLSELYPQLQNKIQFDKENIKFGLLLFMVGFIKKIFFADNIAVIIDPIFLSPENYSSEYLFRSFLLFPLQIYFDFSGYIDMALGASIFVGIQLPMNFNKPYLTTSLTDFWRNWHITLSRWFKDYVYIPLGGSKNKEIVTYRNLLITMSIAGLWHGASLNFIIWGILNGLILCFEKMFNLHNGRGLFRGFINILIIFNLWIVFRITEMSKFFEYTSKLYSSFFDVFTINNYMIIIFVIIMIISQKIDNFHSIKNFSKKTNITFIIIFFIFIISTGLGINLGQSEKFIYFQF